MYKRVRTATGEAKNKVMSTLTRLDLQGYKGTILTHQLIFLKAEQHTWLVAPEKILIICKQQSEHPGRCHQIIDLTRNCFSGWQEKEISNR